MLTKNSQVYYFYKIMTIFFSPSHDRITGIR